MIIFGSKKPQSFFFSACNSFFLAGRFCYSVLIYGMFLFYFQPSYCYRFMRKKIEYLLRRNFSENTHTHTLTYQLKQKYKRLIIHRFKENSSLFQIWIFVGFLLLFWRVWFLDAFFFSGSKYFIFFGKWMPQRKINFDLLKQNQKFSFFSSVVRLTYWYVSAFF